MNDRLVRRVLDRLGPAEGLVASLLGYEEGGRRRHVVLATDRRVIVSPVRPSPAMELGYEQLAAAAALDGALVLTTTDGSQHVVERVTEPRRLELMVELLSGRLGQPAGHHRPAPPKVRILP